MKELCDFPLTPRSLKCSQECCLVSCWSVVARTSEERMLQVRGLGNQDPPVLPSSPSLPPQGVPRFWVLRPLFFFLNSSSCSCCCRSLIVFLLFSILPLMLFLKHPAADVSALQYLSGGRKLNSLHSHGEFIYLSHCLLCPRCSLTNSRKGIQA